MAASEFNNSRNHEGQFLTKGPSVQTYSSWKKNQSLLNPFFPFFFLAQSSSFSNALNVASCSKKISIVDSRALDHMTSHSNLFSSYNPCSGRQKVKIVDGSLSSIARKGSIPISKKYFSSICLTFSKSLL